MLRIKLSMIPKTGMNYGIIDDEKTIDRDLPIIYIECMFIERIFNV